MAIGDIWDEFQNNQYSGSALDAAMGAASGSAQKNVVTTSGNAQWQANQGGNPPPYTPPVPTPTQTPIPQPTPQSNFPAANPAPNRNTKFATNAPINTIMQNLNQVPVGGFGLGFGYQSSPQMNIGNFLNPQTQQSPTVTGYHWTKGTGGVSGGNNDMLRQYMSNGTVRSFTGGVEDNQPLAQTQYTLPGVNADVRALSDPSVGALEGAQRSTNQYGQNVINPAGGGQIISGKGPSFGSLQGSTPAADLQNRPGLNTPSGGQAFAGPSTRTAPLAGPAQNSQTWQFGGWY